MERVIEKSPLAPMDEQSVEVVERKGLGHPDTICDAVVEAIAIALGRAYREKTGAMAPMNVDKALLAGGASTPRFGGGTVDTPMRMILGGRAAERPLGGPGAVAELATATASRWIRDHLRFVDPARHVQFQVEIRPSSNELSQVVGRGVARANDTSVGVGFAPLSRAERTVLEVEHWLNGDAGRRSFPEVGEDIKVLAVRRGDALELTLAIAFVDRFVESRAAYFARKQELAAAVRDRVRQARRFSRVEASINLLDDPTREDAMYLTVLGTSAEAGDDGEVGRGNRVNGLISFGRPNSLEAAAGKNPICHVGKIYNVAAHHIAARIVAEVPAVTDAHVWLVSQIGRPIDDPRLVRVSVGLANGRALESVHKDVDAVVTAELTAIEELVVRLSMGELSVF